MRHRQDIDGLRAVAVVPVVLFHAGVSQIPGGFVGVDIFFVISGYLITSLILGEMSEGRFSLLGFYERRIRRIFPALFTVLAFSSVMALLLFLPNDLRDYDRTLTAATFFVSNIHFYHSQSYFAAPLDSAPLLHTWSLSIEEQFYIVFPLLLIISMYWGRRISIALIAVLFALSLGASIWATPTVPEAAFYLAPMRAWELMLGALLAARLLPPIESRALREGLAVAGIALIAYALFFFSSTTSFPGWLALIPCLGAALVIYAGAEERSTFVARSLSLRPLVLIGLISYSLYLWHWPLLVFARYWNIAPLSPWQSAAIVAASFVLAALSWAYIEQPFRRREAPVSRRVLVGFSAASIVLFASLGALPSSGWPSRFSPQVLAAITDGGTGLEYRACRKKAVDHPCRLGAGVEPSYAVWGDSHGLAMLPALDRLGQERGFALQAYIALACPPIPGLRFVKTGHQKRCEARNAAVLAALEASQGIGTVIIITRSALYLKGGNRGGAHEFGNRRGILGADGERLTGQALAGLWEHQLDAMVGRLLAVGKRVVLVYPLPDFDYDVSTALGRMLATGRDPSSLHLPLASFHERQDSIFAILDRAGESPRILRVYPHKRLCDEVHCLAFADGKALFKDNDHLSANGASYVLPAFDAVFAGRDAPSIAKASPEITSALPVNRVSAQQ